MWLVTEAADNATMCGCRSGSCYVDSSSTECVLCGLGLICPGIGEVTVDVVFYAGSSQDVGGSLFRCYGVSQMRCPGGRPGSCADGRYGVGCAACFPGWTPSYDSMCERCSDSWQLMPFAIACLAASNILIAIYSFRPTAKTSHTFGLCIVCGSHFVTTLQFAGVLQSINVTWTNLLLDVFQVSDLLFLDAKLLRPSCVSNLAPEMVFLGKVSAGMLALCFIVVVHIGSVVTVQAMPFLGASALSLCCVR